jgi:hypothetical protein
MTMFDKSSRYAALARATIAVPGPDGEPRTVVYVRRRFIPPPESHTPLLRYVVRAGDRLDLIAARQIGDPAQFWRIADANGAQDPLDLTAVAGTPIVVALAR